jgi:hypothetical protein
LLKLYSLPPGWLQESRRTTESGALRYFEDAELRGLVRTIIYLENILIRLCDANGGAFEDAELRGLVRTIIYLETIIYL